MSRLLNNKKVKYLLLCVIVILTVAWVSPAELLKYVLLTGVLSAFLLWISHITYLRLKQQMNAFSAKGTVRNVNHLIIGERCDICDSLTKESAIQIEDPGASLTGAFEILQRTYSILRPDGEVIIIICKKNLSNEKLNLIDLFFLHDITIKKFGLSRWLKMKQFVLFIHPVLSIRYLFRFKRKTWNSNTYEDTDINEFCRVRGIICKIVLV